MFWIKDGKSWRRESCRSSQRRKMMRDGFKWVHKVKIEYDKYASCIILHSFDILMKFYHLIMHLLNSYFFIKSYCIWYHNLFFLVCLFLVWFIVKVYVAVLDELFSKLTHTFCVFWFWVVPDDTCSSLVFGDLILRQNLRLRVYLGGIENIASSFIGVGKDATLS